MIIRDWIRRHWWLIVWGLIVLGLLVLADLMPDSLAGLRWLEGIK